MGMFDLPFGAPDASGWQTRVTAGGADPNNLSLAERMRHMLTGSTDPNPAGAELAKMGGNMAQAVLAPKTSSSGKEAAPAAPPPVPGQGNAQMIATLQSGRSPFAAAPQGQRPAALSRPIFSPFGAGPGGR